MKHQSINKIELEDGSNIAVIGGGPAGSFFTYYALGFAQRLGIQITIDVYEAKNFGKIGAGGCNHCGGIISESLVQKLSVDGILIPKQVIQKSINSYTLHIEHGKAIIQTPSQEHRIVSVFRGCGPKGCTGQPGRSFDNYLLGLCEKKGANIIRKRVSGLERGENGVLVKLEKDTKEYDFVVGGVGLGKKSLNMFKEICPEFEPPKMTRAYIGEISMKKEDISSHFGSSMHVFLLDVPKVTFGALIPKENFVTLVLLGNDINEEVVHRFLDEEKVKTLFPDSMVLKYSLLCKCFPFINIKEAMSPYSDRVVLIGDSASSKLYKNGIGAAYITGRAAAKAAVFEGIDKRSLESVYAPVCKDLDRDNRVGKFIFFITRMIQKNSLLKKGLLRTVIKEQNSDRSKFHMSLALWDVFTGSEGYRNIFKRFLSLSLFFAYIRNIFSSVVFPKELHQKTNSNGIGHLYGNGEVIIKQGSLGDCLYVIQEGRVEVVLENNNEEVKIAELGKSEFFGEMGLFESDVRSCTVRALGEAQILTIDKKNFYESIQNDASLAYRLLEKISHRLREANKKL
ncbi:MAG: cyclic nucleotide-binding domain-containing protein [Flavobacteriaceae bacterium]|nr:MAG: cyclic nucleotide-binding domain-containing protein [Flavobacteriaceae bacterium]